MLLKKLENILYLRKSYSLKIMHYGSKFLQISEIDIESVTNGLLILA